MKSDYSNPHIYLPLRVYVRGENWRWHGADDRQLCPWNISWESSVYGEGLNLNEEKRFHVEHECDNRAGLYALPDVENMDKEIEDFCHIQTWGVGPDGSYFCSFCNRLYIGIFVNIGYL